MIGVLTYNVPHRKTYETLCLLKAKGYEDIVVFAEPLHYTKKFTPIYEHRPKNINNIMPDELCNNFGYKYYFQKTIEDVLPKDSKILVCGAGILPESLVQKYKVINAHPGYIPNVRGLDALKWAIFKGEPIGVSTHQIGSEVDAGLLIERKVVPVYSNDTFHAVAQRQFEMEIVMLVEALEKIDAAKEYVEAGDYRVHKRMTREFENLLLTKFEKLKERIAQRE